ncbi:regulatory protein RecX [Bacteroides sp.]|uniref:regulatory protein RecX n=1 Tax=Bacteroides sp. TaxID=29523 RepID=UPI00260961C9|nr:regulatory protein RecX [Bacteroides sp.]MDD3038540.1 regulatory protein RecX [Bacteroides sp.]
MSAQLTEEEALNKVASYCSSAEHCRAEINDKLQRWGIAYGAITRILSQLEAEKYIDDERYCRAFVTDKFRFAKWGKVKIAQGLYMKKIPSDMVWRYLNEIDEEEYLLILNGLLATKRKSIHAQNEFEQNQKLIRFAMSRGFEIKDIKRCIEVLEDEVYEE